MKYKENVGANCSNCDNEDRHVKARCKLCATKDNRAGWDPKPGVLVKEYEVYYGHAKYRGREVIREAI